MYMVECSIITSLRNVWRKEKVSEKIKNGKEANNFLRTLEVASLAVLFGSSVPWLLLIGFLHLLTPVWLGGCKQLGVSMLRLLPSILVSYHFLCLPFLSWAQVCVHVPVYHISGTNTLLRCELQPSHLFSCWPWALTIGYVPPAESLTLFITKL